MPNGKPGDHPYTDIIVHRRPVYSEPADALVREIAELGDERTRTKLADLLLNQYNEFGHPDVARLERVLRSLRDQLLAEAKARGWEGA